MRTYEYCWRRASAIIVFLEEKKSVVTNSARNEARRYAVGCASGSVFGMVLYAGFLSTHAHAADFFAAASSTAR